MKSLLLWCAYAICWITWSFYADHETVISILVVLRWFDTITGIVKFFRLWRLASKWIRYWTIAKWLLLCIPYLFHLLMRANWLESDADIILSMIFSILSLAELISIIQNISVILSGKDIKEQDAITKIINWILAIMNILLEQTIWRLQRSVWVDPVKKKD